MRIVAPPSTSSSDGVFVGSGIFKASNPEPVAKAVVRAVTHFNEPEVLAEVSRGLGEAMPGLDLKGLKPEELLSSRGW